MILHLAEHSYNSIFKEIQKNYKNSVDEICILIGPEASFSEKEREFIQKNLHCIKVSLGKFPIPKSESVTT